MTVGVKGKIGRMPLIHFTLLLALLYGSQQNKRAHTRNEAESKISPSSHLLCDILVTFRVESAKK